jgi:hypothetical protein
MFGLAGLDQTGVDPLVFGQVALLQQQAPTVFGKRDDFGRSIVRRCPSRRRLMCVVSTSPLSRRYRRSFSSGRALPLYSVSRRSAVRTTRKRPASRRSCFSSGRNSRPTMLLVDRAGRRGSAEATGRRRWRAHRVAAPRACGPPADDGARGPRCSRDFRRWRMGLSGGLRVTARHVR